MATETPPAMAPTMSSRASAAVDKIADTASAQPVIAPPRPRRRNSRYEKTSASCTPANGIVIDRALLA